MLFSASSIVNFELLHYIVFVAGLLLLRVVAIELVRYSSAAEAYINHLYRNRYVNRKISIVVLVWDSNFRLSNLQLFEKKSVKERVHQAGVLGHCYWIFVWKETFFYLYVISKTDNNYQVSVLLEIPHTSEVGNY